MSSVTVSVDQRPDPLLHSLQVFWEQIRAALEIVQPRRIAEIGSESGGMTAALTRWAQAHGAEVVSIDPQHAPAAYELAQASPGLELISGASPWALEQAGPADVWLIDGDHNHWTVARELEHVFAQGDRLAILHDIGWPCARRDQYYAPERIPAAARRPYRYDGGVTLGNRGLIDGGFRGEGAFAYAEHEGGPANGVLTAVEDLMATRLDLALITLPCVFGVGFLFSVDSLWADALAAALAPLDDLALLHTLEQNRLDLYLRLLESQDDRARERAGVAARLHALEAENAALRAALGARPS